MEKKHRIDVQQIITLYDQIDAGRCSQLDRLAQIIHKQLIDHHELNLAFICTHNSRRSHLAQSWFWIACQHFQIIRVNCLSAGTESTALNHRIVASMKRFGLRITKTESTINAKFLLKNPFNQKQLLLYSKTVDTFESKKENLMAIMVCDHASEHCPLVYFKTIAHLHYRDPKYADDSPHESEAYDEAQQKIQVEMFYLANRLAEYQKD